MPRNRYRNAEPDPLNRDYGFGFTDEGRPITGIEDGNFEDPNAEIFEPKGRTINVDLSKVKPKMAACADNAHEMVKDDDPMFPAEKCRKCGLGRLLPK